MTTENLLLKLIFSIAMIFIFYQWIKGIIVNQIPKFQLYFKGSRRYSVSEVAGVLELSLIASCHVLYAWLVLFIFHVSWKSLGITTLTPALFFEGILLGIGTMGFATLLCRVAVEFLETLCPQKVPQTLQAWAALARGGWIRHHLHSISVLPFYLSLLILFMQVGSEEIVFRGGLLNYFLPFGSAAALMISTLFFAGMQIFHTRSWLNALFPTLSSLVMGVVHGMLYLKTKCLLPLIISHVTFFLFSVL